MEHHSYSVPGTLDRDWTSRQRWRRVYSRRPRQHC